MLLLLCLLFRMNNNNTFNNKCQCRREEIGQFQLGDDLCRRYNGFNRSLKDEQHTGGKKRSFIN